MKRYLITYLLGLLFAAPLAVQAKVNVFACEPEWAALTEAIGGDKVKAYAATHASQDPHYIRARPSLIAKVRKAELLICSGAGLEAGWLPLLLQKASANVQPGQTGYLMASEWVPVLEKSAVHDRSMGDIHPEGNPHVHLNPYNLLKVASELSKRLAVLDVDNADYYRQRHEAFSQKWQLAVERWERESSHLRGVKVITHHRSFSYLLDWLSIEAVDSLESKPGIPPTTSHLETILQKLKTESARVILRAPYEPDEASEWLSQKAEIPAVVLPYTVGGDRYSDDLFALFEQTLKLLKESVHVEH